MSTISLCTSKENKYVVYRGKDCMKMFSVPLREQAMKIINFKKRKMKLLTNEQQSSLSKEMNLKINMLQIKNVHSMCNLKYRVPKEIPIVFTNGSNFSYHFIIKELAEEFAK